MLNPLHICLDPSIGVHKHSLLDQTVKVKKPIDWSHSLSPCREHVRNDLSEYVIEHIRHHDFKLLLFMEFIKIVNVLLDLVLIGLLLDDAGVFNFWVFRGEIRVLEEVLLGVGGLDGLL